MNDNISQKETYGTRQEGPSEQTREPILSVPPVTLILLIINLALFFMRYVVSDNFYEAIMIVFSFIPARFAEAWHSHVIVFLTPFTYMFLHGNGLHITMNTAMLLGIGSGVEKVLGAWRYLAFYVICGLLAVIGHFILMPGGMVPLVGASGAISGLFGGVLLMMQQMGRFKPGVKGILPVVLIWTAVNIIMGLVGVPGEELISIAWVAHLAGFYAGLALFPVFLKRI